MAITASFSAEFGSLSVFGDVFNNTISISHNVAGRLLVNGGAVQVLGGLPNVENTTQIRVFGLGGNDVIEINEVSDRLPRALLFGSTGNDTLRGGSGNDQLFGQDGNDTLLGRGGIDFLFGGNNDDLLTGGDSNDQVFGQAGNDRLISNPGDDTDLNEGGADIDTIEVNGGGGDEIFGVSANGTRVRFERFTPAPFALDIGTAENLVVNMNNGSDRFSATGNLAALIKTTVDGGGGNDIILGSNGADTLLGGAGNDLLLGRDGDDLLLGGDGDDVLGGGSGIDGLDGGAGVNVVLQEG